MDIGLGYDELKGDQLDFILQTFRTMCLSCKLSIKFLDGASLICTSIYKHSTLYELKNYIIHRLFHTKNVKESEEKEHLQLEVVTDL